MTFKLSVMMFLQYAIWGAWLPILFPYLGGGGGLGFSDDDISGIFAAGAAGAIVGPFIAGQFADRHFATEKFLGVSHLLGAVLVWFLAGVKDADTFFWLSAAYGVIYAPTIALTYSLSFHHLPDRDRDLGKVRVWGTIGWIVAGILVGQWLATRYSPEGMTGDALMAEWNRGRADAFKLSAILGVVLGLYSFTLPHTPPKKDAVQKNAVAEAFGFFRKQPLLTLFLLAIPMSCVHQFYFVHTSEFLSGYQSEGSAGGTLANSINGVLGVGGGGLMTIGQMSEIAVLALIPLLAKRFTRKTLLATGLVAYAVRMVLFAYTDNLYAALLGVALHGFCFGCFIFVAFMVVDEETPADVRASAQNLFNLVIVGIGIIVGSWFAVSKVKAWALERIGLAADAKDVPLELKPEFFRHLFSVPMWIAIGCLAVLLIAYPGGRRAEATEKA